MMSGTHQKKCDEQSYVHWLVAYVKLFKMLSAKSIGALKRNLTIERCDSP